MRPPAISPPNTVNNSIFSTLAINCCNIKGISTLNTPKKACVHDLHQNMLVQKIQHNPYNVIEYLIRIFLYWN